VLEHRNRVSLHPGGSAFERNFPRLARARCGEYRFDTLSELLDTIVRATRTRIEERRARVPQSELERRVAAAPPPRSLFRALSAEPFSVIAEHKRRSPSGGAMNADNTARCLQVYGTLPWVSAVSVLTDEDHFDGSLDDLALARKHVGERPILRKDFIVDEYQVWEARAFDADAILLMTAVHTRTPDTFVRLFQLATELGLECLIELGLGDGDPEELAKMVPSTAKLWGVNARAFSGNAKQQAESEGSLERGGRDLFTSLDRHDELLPLVPPGAIAVAESGLKTVNELVATAHKGFRAALIGTAFVKGPASVEAVASELGSAFEGARFLRG
jgi:indole-3-glycerol phosphate synthase